MQNIRSVSLLCILCIAALTDAKKQEISNRLILAGFFINTVLVIFSTGMSGILTVLLNSVLPIIIFYPLFLTHSIGAGDIKLFSVTSSYIGVKLTMLSCILTFFMAAVYAFLCRTIKKEKEISVALAPYFLTAALIILTAAF